MLEELKFSIGGMAGWTKITVNAENDIVHYAVDSIMDGITNEKKLRKAVSKIFLHKIEGLQINKWKSKYQPPEEIMICDGTQWELDYKETGKRCRHIYGDNAYPDNWEDFLNIMDMLYPLIDENSIQNVLIEFNMLNTEYSENLNIIRKDGVVMYETRFDNERRVFSLYVDKNGVREFLDELSCSEIPKANTNANTNAQGIVGDNVKNIGRYKCTITYHAQEKTVAEGIYDRDGIPENWASFINSIKEFLSGYEHRELFNPELY